MHKGRAALLGGTAFLVAMSPATASAQAGGPAQSDTAAQAGAEGNVLADIVVTARRRAESILDVPVSVTALTGTDLANRGIVRVEDLQTTAPSLRVAPTLSRRNNSQYELRGITTTESLITQDPAVGIYVNEVYRARATGTNQSFYDIANVQVLYGPQGTLFGRNSTGGAVLISTNPPTDRFEGSIEAGYGNYDQYQITGMLNLPISDKVALRLAGQRSRSDGYARNISTGAQLGGTNNYSFRGSLLYKPTDGIENLLVGSVYHANDQASPTILYGYRSSAAPDKYGQVSALPAAGFNPLLLAFLAQQRAIGPYRAVWDSAGATIQGPAGPIPLTGRTGYMLRGSRLETTNPYERARNYSISNMTTAELADGLTLKNIFGYNRTKLESSSDVDGTPLKLIDNYYFTTNTQYSDELQLQGESDRLNWVVGGLYFRERGFDYQPAVQFIARFGEADLTGVNTSVAVFAQGTYKLVDRLSVTAGGRYTWDKREYSYGNALSRNLGPILAVNGGLGADLATGATCYIAPSVVNSGTCARTGSKTFKEPSWTVSLDYKLNDDALIYVAHRHGYRAGGFNPRISPTANAAQQLAQSEPFLPEKVNDLEVGFKGAFRLGQTTIRPSIALYRSWYTQIQKQITTFVNGSGTATITNASDAQINGIEAELAVIPAPWLEVTGYWGYVDGNYLDYPVPGVAAGSAGMTIPKVPFAASRHTGGITGTVTPLNDEALGRVSLTANFSFRSHFFGDQALPTLNPEARIPAQQNLNLNMTWANVGGSPITATAWMRNVADSVQYKGVTDLVPSFGIAPATTAEPRMYGFTLRYEFGQ